MTMEDHNAQRTLHIVLNESEAAQLKFHMDRSLNTLDPKRWGPVAERLDKLLQNFIDGKAIE